MENPDKAVEIMIEHFPEMAPEWAFHFASFDAAIPLIVPGGTRIGSVDCQEQILGDSQLPESACTQDILELAREGQ